MSFRWLNALTSLLLFGAALGCSSASSGGSTEIAKGPSPSGPTTPDGPSGGPSDVSPQPQPAPAEMPNIYLDRWTIRSAGHIEIEIEGARPASNGLELLLVNLDLDDRVHVIPVDGGAFRATVPGRLGDRLLIVARDASVVGFPTHVQAEERPKASEDCLKPPTMFESPVTVVPGAPELTLSVDNHCGAAVAAFAKAIDGDVEEKRLELASNRVTSIALALKAPIAAPMAVVLRDNSGKARLGAFYLPAPPE